MEKKESKKSIILKLFYSTEWTNSPSGELTKTFSRDEFDAVGLYGNIENSQQHCDVIYARKIIQELGHRVLIGGWFHVYKDKLKK